MSFIEFSNISHRFSDGSYGIRGISLSIEQGAFVVVAGANGSGKTTLLRHLNGLLTPTSGSIILDGQAVADDILRARMMVGMVFQDADTQIVGETVYDDVAFGPENLRLDHPEIEQRVKAALETVGLHQMSARPPHLLSGGEKRRLAIAGVLAMRPRVLVFDEPFSNLDYPGIRQVLSQIVDLHRSGHTIIMSTHDIEKVLAQTDRLIIMAAGQVVRDGKPDTLTREIEQYGVREPCASRLGTEIESWLT